MVSVCQCPRTFDAIFDCTENFPFPGSAYMYGASMKMISSQNLRSRDVSIHSQGLTKLMLYHNKVRAH